MNGVQKFCIVLIILLILLNEKCIEGLKVKPRIISGNSVKPGEFPWLAILKRTRRGDLQGAGTVISEQWVLTAAHAIFDLRSIYVVLGTTFWNNAHAVSIYSKNLHPHPKFNITNLNNDIALIKLNRRLKFNSYIKPIALVSHSDHKYGFFDTPSIIAGFGYIHDDVPNPFGDLLKAEVVLISNDECENLYEDNIIESNICSIGADSSNQSICEGDSGGPLITRDRHGNLVLIGVISFSAEVSCEMNHPSAFARVSSYLDFISKMTNETLSSN